MLHLVPPPDASDRSPPGILYFRIAYDRLRADDSTTTAADSQIERHSLVSSLAADSSRVGEEAPDPTLSSVGSASRSSGMLKLSEHLSRIGEMDQARASTTLPRLPLLYSLPSLPTSVLRPLYPSCPRIRLPPSPTLAPTTYSPAPTSHLFYAPLRPALPLASPSSTTLFLEI